MVHECLLDTYACVSGHKTDDDDDDDDDDDFSIVSLADTTGLVSHSDSISQFSWTASVRQQFPLRAATDET